MNYFTVKGVARTQSFPQPTGTNSRSQFDCWPGRRFRDLEQGRPPAATTAALGNQPRFTVTNQLERIFCRWMNIFLIAAPVGIALNYALDTSKTAVFLVNFVAIIPLASLLSFATEEIEHHLGPFIGGFLNATFGNAVELIIAVAALLKREVEVAKTSMIGSVLSNLLPVLGCCLFFGGLRYEEQIFSPLLTQTANSLLVLALASVTTPTALTLVIHDRAVLMWWSRAAAIILLLAYLSYLYFQLFSHRKAIENYNQTLVSHVGQDVPSPQTLCVPTAPTGEAATAEQSAEDQPGDNEDPQLLLSVAIILLIVATVVIAFCAECMVGSIDGLVAAGPLSKYFVGLIVLPIVGNAAEHATAVKVAMNDDMDLAISIAVGSSIQVALLLLPLVAVIGWGLNLPVVLDFSPVVVAALLFTVMLITSIVSDGKSNWLEGLLLLCLYALMASSAFCISDSDVGR